jgi:hypothetical protein
MLCDVMRCHARSSQPRRPREAGAAMIVDALRGEKKEREEGKILEYWSIRIFGYSIRVKYLYHNQ